MVPADGRLPTGPTHLAAFTYQLRAGALCCHMTGDGTWEALRERRDRHQGQQLWARCCPLLPRPVQRRGQQGEAACGGPPEALAPGSPSSSALPGSCVCWSPGSGTPRLTFACCPPDADTLRGHPLATGRPRPASVQHCFMIRLRASHPPAMLASATGPAPSPWVTSKLPSV